MHMLRTAGSLLLLIAIATLSSCGRTDRVQRDVFPLATGNRWQYAGKHNGEPVILYMRIVRLLKKENMTYAVISGYPEDVLGGTDWEASSWGLLSAGGRYFYRIRGPGCDSLLKAFSGKGNVAGDLVSGREMFLVSPLDTGKFFGEAAQLSRNDGNYCWRVTEREAFEGSSIAGLKLSGPLDRFTLVYRSTADEVIMDVVPGIGIVRYRYSHHGTPDELDLRLTAADLKQAD